jgi:NADH-quinone oxidoreductase subunit L
MDARDILHLAWVIPVLPAIGAVILLLFGKKLGEPKAGWLATAMIGLSFVASVVAFFALRSLHPEQRVETLQNVSQGFTWMEVGGFVVDFRFIVDPLSSVMILFVTGVGTLIHMYSIGYMHGDPRYSRFFAYLNLFAASMLTLVLGSNFLMTFLGWEGVGLCSYLLISFWFERNSAAVAGKKAFVTNRVGDFGFMLAMFLIFQHLGTLSYAPLNEGTLPISNTTATAIALLLFVGAMGKSAQVPLHIWLPDAMEGPTPVSALIHAATMVTAGVFLIVRAHVFFELSDHAGMIVAWVGAGTALFAALVALVQNDIKRVLAYSTISQLGYMFLAVGIGAYTAGVFHMVTHAFFKALLFLAAGSVIHGLHDEQDMRRMGALKKFMPFTFGVFIVGWLAIAGVIPLAGFWSKDDILAQAWFRDEFALWAVGIVVAAITAFYMTRQVWLVFYADERWNKPAEVVTDAPEVEAESGADADVAVAHAATDTHDDHGHAGTPHESPLIMLIPLFALAVLSFVGGGFNLPFQQQKLELLAAWLEPMLHGVPIAHASSFNQGAALSGVALFVGVLGILVGWRVYKNGLRADGRDPFVVRLGGFAKVLANAFYIDAAVAWFVRVPGTWFANFLSNIVDRRGIDGAVNGIGHLFKGGGDGLSKVQTGVVRNYALGVMLGAVILIAYFATRVSF